MSKILHQYQNGNVTTTIHSDGTKVNEWEGDMLVEFPSSCDLKITQFCDLSDICGFCLVPDTLVMTLNGCTKICDLQREDIILSKNLVNGEWEYKSCLHLFTRNVEEEIYEIELENGEIIKITGNHKVYTSDGYVRADELTENHKILSI